MLTSAFSVPGFCDVVLFKFLSANTDRDSKSSFERKEIFLYNYIFRVSLSQFF